MADDVLTGWLSERAVSVPLSATGAVRVVDDDLGTADVVGLGAAVRHASATMHAMRAVVLDLVTHHGFRAIFMEGTDPPYATGTALDRFVVHGDGDPVALLASSQSFARTHELLDVVLAVRAHNERHPADPVRIVHGDAGFSTELAAVEQQIADRVLAWRDATGERVIHWGGAAHVLAGDPRGIGNAPRETHRNAGGHLRAALGRGFVAVAATVGEVAAGADETAVRPVPASFTEAALSSFDEPVWVPIRAASAPPPVQAWLDAPLHTRMIGPSYDPVRDADHHVTAPSVRDAVDAFLHVPRSEADTPL